MSRSPAVPSLPRSAAGPLTGPAASGLLVWTCLWIVYVVWGSTYLAIRVMVETVPPLLGAGSRFLLAGALMLAFLTVRKGAAAVRPTRRQVLGCLGMGILMPGANAVVTVAEVSVPSALTALLIAVTPLVVIVLRMLARETISRRSLAAVAVGFVGVAILLLPGERPDGASLLGMLAIVFAAAMWGTGSFLSPRTDLPRDPFISTAWQMVLGGGAIVLAGALAGEVPEVRPEQFSAESVAAFAYLVVFGSLIAFSAYVWLLQNVPVSKVATYAYVNPVIAIILGWLILDEQISGTTLIGAAVIVASVAAVVRIESAGRRAAASRR